jgi:ribosomal protein L2
MAVFVRKTPAAILGAVELDAADKDWAGFRPRSRQGAMRKSRIHPHGSGSHPADPGGQRGEGHESRGDAQSGANDE